MSLTARERRNPPPRRKSCAACIKAKRRCDMGVPACQRCSHRSIPCVYPTRTTRGPQPRASSQALVDTMPGVLIEDSVSSSPCTQLESFGEGFDSADSALDVGFTDLETFDFPIDEDTLGLIQQSTAVAPPSTKSFGTLPAVISNRLQWAVDEIKKAPSMMVLETQTPWCHPLVYKDGMPRSIQDAHACCALYLAKNRTNAPVIFRSIESRVNDLLCAPSPSTPLESLAQTQSLLLYQIIRLFDGDVSARATAERDLSAVETSAIALYSHAKFDHRQNMDLPLFPIAPTKTFWQEWILQESIRRTLILTFFFLQAYRIMTYQKGLHCDGKLGLCHSWTISKYLWEASSPMMFAEAWKNKKHFVVSNAVFNEVLQEAMADDVDTFGRIFITSLVGVDDAEGWFASRGGSL